MTLRKIQNRVDSKGGLACVPMSDLRPLTTKSKLGPGVCRDISRQLNAVGIDHFPRELPSDHAESVYLYRTGSRAERLIRAFIYPSEEGTKIIKKST
jgi:hypothetical protein